MYKINMTHVDDFIFNAQAKNHSFIIDAKSEKGICPSDLLLSSIGSCIGVYIQKYLKGTNINLEKFDIAVNAEFTQENPVHFAEINVSINFKKTDFDEKRKNSILHFIKNCPIHHTLKLNPNINYTIY